MACGGFHEPMRCIFGCQRGVMAVMSKSIDRKQGAKKVVRYQQS